MICLPPLQLFFAELLCLQRDSRVALVQCLPQASVRQPLVSVVYGVGVPAKQDCSLVAEGVMANVAAWSRRSRRSIGDGGSRFETQPGG